MQFPSHPPFAAFATLRPLREICLCELTPIPDRVYRRHAHAAHFRCWTSAYISVQEEMRLEIAEREEDGWIIFSLAGSIDNYTANDFRERVTNRLRDAGNGIILDCSSLNFVSSAGLRVFVILAKHVGAAGNPNLLTVSNVRPTLMRFFEVAGLAGMLRFVPSLEVAMSTKA